jgi:hypothetical protein
MTPYILRISGSGTSFGIGQIIGVGATIPANLAGYPALKAISVYAGNVRANVTVTATLKDPSGATICTFSAKQRADISSPAASVPFTVSGGTQRTDLMLYNGASNIPWPGPYGDGGILYLPAVEVDIPQGSTLTITNDISSPGIFFQPARAIQNVATDWRYKEDSPRWQFEYLRSNRDSLTGNEKTSTPPLVSHSWHWQDENGAWQTASGPTLDTDFKPGQTLLFLRSVDEWGQVSLRAGNLTNPERYYRINTYQMPDGRWIEARQIEPEPAWIEQLIAGAVASNHNNARIEVWQDEPATKLATFNQSELPEVSGDLKGRFCVLYRLITSGANLLALFDGKEQVGGGIVMWSSNQVKVASQTRLTDGDFASVGVWSDGTNRSIRFKRGTETTWPTDGEAHTIDAISKVEAWTIRQLPSGYLQVKNSGGITYTSTTAKPTQASDWEKTTI